MLNRSPAIWKVVPYAGPAITFSFGLIRACSFHLLVPGFTSRYTESARSSFTRRPGCTQLCDISRRCRKSGGAVHLGVARAFINAYPQDEVRKQKREART